MLRKDVATESRTPTTGPERVTTVTGAPAQQPASSANKSTNITLKKLFAGAGSIVDSCG